MFREVVCIFFLTRLGKVSFTSGDSRDSDTADVKAWSPFLENGPNQNLKKIVEVPQKVAST